MEQAEKAAAQGDGKQIKMQAFFQRTVQTAAGKQETEPSMIQGILWDL